MAVPRYVRSEELKPVSSPEMGPAAFGGDEAVVMSKMGASFGHIADVMEAHALKIQEKKDRAKVLEVTAGFNRRLNESLYGENGLFLRQGLDAHNTFRDVVGLIDEYAEASAALAENDNQAEAIRAYILSNRNTFESQAAKHEAMEVRKAELKEADSLVVTWKETAVNSYGDPEVMAAVESNVRAIYEASLGSYGKAVVDESVKNAMSAIHVGVLDKYLVDYDTDGARAYFDVYKEEINFAERNTIEGKIAKGEMVTWAQEEAEKIAGKFGYDNEWAALEHIRENYKGDKEDMLMKYVQGLYVDYRRTRVKEATGDDADKVIEAINTAELITDKLTLLERANLPDATKKTIRGWILSGGFPSSITDVQGNDFASIVGTMASIDAAQIDQNTLFGLFAGRATQSTFELAARIGTMGPEVRANIAYATDQAMNVFQVPARSIPSFVTSLLQHDLSKGIDQNTLKIAISPFVPVGAPSSVAWTNDEIKDIARKASKSLDNVDRGLVEASVADILKQDSNNSHEEKYRKSQYYNKEVIIGKGKYGNVTVPGSLIPKRAQIVFTPIDGESKVLTEKERDDMIETGRILFPDIDESKLGVTESLARATTSSNIVWDIRWRILEGTKWVDLVEWLKAKGLLEGDISPLLTPSNVDPGKGTVTLSEWLERGRLK